VGLALGAPRPPAVCAGSARAVVLIPVHCEDPRAVGRRLRQMRAGLRAAGQAHRFDWAVLSDTRDPRLAEAERAMVLDLATGPDGGGRVFYRRRSDNAGRKAGNIAAFLRRSGAAWEFAVVLDADSLMAGETLVAMLDRIEAEADLGLLQTLPRITGAESRFARAQAFAAALYGPVHARGLAAMQGATGPFWGHNAIFRTGAFAAACGLPQLPGRPPFGGAILSHDTVEAAFLARAGWRVRFDPDLGGSWEQTPETLIDHARRDRRWAQGNLQHAGVIGAAGLPGWSRFQIAQGIMAYLASPLWLLLLVVAGLGAAGAGAPWALAGMSAVLLLGPRVAIVLRTVAGDCRGFGGRLALLRSAAGELALSALVAPVLMLMQARAVAAILRGCDGGWPPQRRSGGAVARGEAWAAMRPCAAAGVAMLAAGVALPGLLWWVWPVAVPLMLSPALTVALSQRGERVMFLCPGQGRRAPRTPPAPALQPRAA
jgi:membrane glycosyltransferase